MYSFLLAEWVGTLGLAPFFGIAVYEIYNLFFRMEKIEATED